MVVRADRDAARDDEDVALEAPLDGLARRLEVVGDGGMADDNRARGLGEQRRS